LAMVLGYHGKTVRLKDLRELVGGRGGANARTLLEAASGFGLEGQGVALEVEDLASLDRASVLHWEFNHFVVFERARRDAVLVLDPAHGRRAVPMEEFRKSFTGVALLFEPTEAFEPGASRSSSLARYARQIFSYASHWWRILVMSILLQLL